MTIQSVALTSPASTYCRLGPAPANWRLPFLDHASWPRSCPRVCVMTLPPVARVALSFTSYSSPSPHGSPDHPADITTLPPSGKLFLPCFICFNSTCHLLLFFKHVFNFCFSSPLPHWKVSSMGAVVSVCFVYCRYPRT